MTVRLVRAATASLTALVLGAGCDRAPAVTTDVFTQPAAIVAAPTDPLIARVDGQPIHESEALARARQRELPPSEANAAQLVDDLVLEDLLATEARRQQLHGDPEVRHAVRRAIVQRLIEEDFEAKVTKESIPEEGLRRLYKANFWFYNKPEMRSFEHLLVNCVRTAPAEKHAAARGLTEALLALAQERNPKTLEELLPEAKLRAAKLGLEVGTQTGRSPRTQLEVEFANMLYTLPAGRIGDRVVKSRYGYHLVRTVQIDPPVERSFESVREQVRERAWPIYRQGRFRQWVTELRAQYGAKLADTAHQLFRDPAAARK